MRALAVSSVAVVPGVSVAVDVVWWWLGRTHILTDGEGCNTHSCSKNYHLPLPQPGRQRERLVRRRRRMAVISVWRRTLTIT